MKSLLIVFVPGLLFMLFWAIRDPTTVTRCWDRGGYPAVERNRVYCDSGTVMTVRKTESGRGVVVECVCPPTQATVDGGNE